MNLFISRSFSPQLVAGDSSLSIKAKSCKSQRTSPFWPLSSPLFFIQHFCLFLFVPLLIHLLILIFSVIFSPLCPPFLYTPVVFFFTLYSFLFSYSFFFLSSVSTFPNEFFFPFPPLFIWWLSFVFSRCFFFFYNCCTFCCKVLIFRQDTRKRHARRRETIPRLFLFKAGRNEILITA